MRRQGTVKASYVCKGIKVVNCPMTIKDSAGGGNYQTIAAAQSAGAVTVNIGLFINTVISFTIVAFCVFLLVKGMNKLRQTPTPAPVNTKECHYCFTTIPLKAVKCPNCVSELK
ncbi:MAG: MscL family protein [Endomicrobia bacterium]|nr:MscL family protein [Endomicrobiia bacterium]